MGEEASDEKMHDLVLTGDSERGEMKAQSDREAAMTACRIDCC